ncbi:MAG: adenine deaminase [Opitutales bacterium]|jgi:adenine deaminase
MKDAPGPMVLSGNIADVVSGRTFAGRVEVAAERIARVVETGPAQAGAPWFTPGLVDAHVHVESTMLAPSEFARVAVTHGTVATVSDPHEIANVLGVAGVRWMLADAQRAACKIFFGAPSCVPATSFETAGAKFGAKEVGELLDDPAIRYLSEVMNFPGVIYGDATMRAIVAEAKKRGKPVDGHAPGVRGEDLKKYVAAGIQTDHECTTLDEAREKAALGMKIWIREGSAARNFEALWPLLLERPELCGLCSDDKHPDELLVSQIDELVRRAVAHGVPVMDALRAATLNPVRHYGLPVGLLQANDPADIIEVGDLRNFKVKRTWVNGRLVAEEGRPLAARVTVTPVNVFHAGPKRAADFQWRAQAGKKVRVIEAIDGQIVTGETVETPKVTAEGMVACDTGRDLLKLTVVNRYADAPPEVALVRNFGLKRGALASSVAHDSHNVVAVGTSDEELARAVNLVIRHGGGLSFASGETEKALPLPIAGLMATGDAATVGAAYRELSELARAAGCGLKAPYMCLSFLALLVIPQLKLSDKGLFDVGKFSLVEPWVD